MCCRCIAACPPGEFANVNHTCMLCDISFALKPHTDLTARECVAECPSGEEMKGGNGADRRHCQACENCNFADHVDHACATECPTGTIANSATLNCDPPAGTPAPTPPPPPIPPPPRRRRKKRGKRPREALWRRLWRQKQMKRRKKKRASRRRKKRR